MNPEQLASRVAQLQEHNQDLLRENEKLHQLVIKLYRGAEQRRRHSLEIVQQSCKRVEERRAQVDATNDGIQLPEEHSNPITTELLLCLLFIFLVINVVIFLRTNCEGFVQ